jgi:GT2 family glycosyltransferase
MTQANPAIHEISESADPPVSEHTATAQVVLVLGMHRSGTSALARVLNLLGVELGSDLLPAAADNEMGFWEHRQVQFIHDRIYEDLERDWTNVSRLPPNWWIRPEIHARREQLKQVLQRDFGRQNLWGIKDPRLCAMLPLWRPLLEEIHCQPKCVLIFRNPLEVVKSLEKRDKISAARTYLLWLRSVIEAEQQSRHLPRALTTFERILADWKTEVARLGKSLRIDWPTSVDQISKAVGEFIQPSSRHHQVQDDEFLLDDAVPEQVRRMYAAVLSAAASGHIDDLSATVDQIDKELEESQPLLTQFVKDLEAEARSIVIDRNKDAIRLGGEIARISHAMAEQARVATTEVAARDAALLQSGNDQTALREHIGALAKDQNALREHIGALSAEKNQLLQHAAESAKLLRQKADACSALAVELEQARAAATELSEKIAAQRDSIAQKNILLDQTRAEQIDTNKQLAKANNELRQLRIEVTQAYRTRDTLGPFLRKFWKSGLWLSAKPAWLLARALGKLDKGMDDLVPLTLIHRAPDGTWQGSELPHFLIPTAPLTGWVRVRAKIKSAVATRAALYFDTGGAFHQREHFELAAVAGDTEIDRMVALKSPTYLIRFDPLQAAGEFALQSFSLQPMSSFYFNSQAILRNIKKLITGRGSHRPSPWIALKLLFSGDFSKFHSQLVTNVESSTAVSEYDLWRRRHVIDDAARQRMRDTLAQWKNPPKISVLMPVYNVPEIYLRKSIDSVVNQIYPNWELCIADDASPKGHIKKVLKEYAAKDSRIKVVYQEKNGGISTASNAALQLVTGEFVALLDHDDEIAEHALFKVAEAIVADPTLDMIYSDEDKMTPAGKHHDPFFKPDWSPEYFLACMYTCHLGVYRTELIKKVGGWRKEFDSAQDYDLVLRLTGSGAKVHHIPDVLYHWRTIPTSTAANKGAKPEAHQRAQRALEEYLKLVNRPGTVEEGPSDGFHRIRFAIKDNPLVSIVIPSACREIELRGKKTWFVLECVASIRRMSSYKNIEIIVLDNDDMSEPLANALAPYEIRKIAYTEPFNLARKMNLGGFSARGEQLILLNDDIEVITPDWIEAMLEFSQWPEIGAVGAQLLFPNDTQQHNGVNVLEGNPGHPFYQFPGDHPGYYNSSLVHRNWSAVTGACLMTRKDVYESVGGFSEEFPLNYNDVDYCLKVNQAGKRVVYTPYAKLYHHESVSKAGTDVGELEAFKKRWADRFPRDPHYNPNLTMQTCDFRIG